MSRPNFKKPKIKKILPSEESINQEIKYFKTNDDAYDGNKINSTLNDEVGMLQIDIDWTDLSKLLEKKIAQKLQKQNNCKNNAK